MVRRLADLHLHTNASDGILSVSDLVKKVAGRGIKIFSITDHDNFDALDEADKLAQEYNLTSIPGIELGISFEGKEVHILAYFFDRTNEELLSLLKYLKSEREHRAIKIIQKLSAKGFKIGIEEVLIQANGAPIVRPHIAQVLYKKGYVKNPNAAYHLYLANHASCYEPKIFISPNIVFDTISKSGGISSIAHCGNLPDNLVMNMIESGLDAIEIQHPSHSTEQVNFLRKLTESYFLLVTGGSDYHGDRPADESNLGKYFVYEAEVDAIKQRLQKRKLA